MRRRPAGAQATKFNWRNFRENWLVQRAVENRRNALFFSVFHCQSPIARATLHLSPVANDARNYTGQNPLSKGIFLAAAQFATDKLHPVVCCITVPLRPLACCGWPCCGRFPPSCCGMVSSCCGTVWRPRHNGAFSAFRNRSFGTSDSGQSCERGNFGGKSRRLLPPDWSIWRNLAGIVLPRSPYPPPVLPFRSYRLCGVYGIFFQCRR